MITIHHNFDETKFMWLWARYVKSGNINKHCVNSIPGPYSKKFSGASNKDLLSQPVLVMDEVPEGQYEAIYFCGVLKAGYQHKNVDKNNYRHNVHFAVRPQEGAHEVWDFENWHVEIENGMLEHIPAAYELGDKFFKAPYDAHYYTCRIFRWMVGHFYPNELRKLEIGAESQNDNSDLAKDIVRCGFEYAKQIYEGDPKSSAWKRQLETKGLLDNVPNGKDYKTYVLSKAVFDRNLFFKSCIPEDWIKWVDFDGLGVIQSKYRSAHLSTPVTPNNIATYFEMGVNEFLDLIAPYQER